MRVGVLASGTGTILEALLAAGIDVSVVVVDRPCRATEIADQAGIAAVLVERTSFGKDFDRLTHTKEVVNTLQSHGAELVAIAGYGTILDAVVYDAYPDRVLNTHPSLLPAFKGWHAVEEALEYGVKVTGCTVHLATADVDAGPILAQTAVTVEPDDTVDTLHERIKTVERRLYPETVARYAARLATTPKEP
ncbi:MAG TPA: phosphoribosylglycinamide formyltransferase [Acidimicrobiales bacterium]|nr:phosphoribosylglycinamide formyltransferase [Acidimicrobiales bacterium]